MLNSTFKDLLEFTLRINTQKDIILKVLENLDFLTVLEYNISDV